MILENFERLDMTHARRELTQLYERVTHGKGRIEITRRGSNETCVIISKDELEALEKALEILSDSEGVKAMRETMALVVSAAV